MKWTKSDLKILVGRMGWVRSYAFRRTALHRALFDDLPLITRVACSSNWSDIGYLENDRVSCIKFLGQLKCLTRDLFGHSPLFEMMARPQLPSLDCFRAVMEVLGPPKADDPDVSVHPLIYIALRRELTLEMVDLFQTCGYDLSWKCVNGKDLLSELACGGHPVNPEVTDRLLAAGCKGFLSDVPKPQERLEQILREHSTWKASQERLFSENAPSGSSYGPDWRR